MSDTDNMQASEQEATVEQTTAESQTDNQTNDSPEAFSEAASEQGQTADASTGDNSKSENQDAKIDLQPLSRRSAKFRIQQLVEENNQLKKQVQPVQRDEWEDPQDDPQPDIAALVAKEIEKRLHPVISQSEKTADDGELGELFTGDKAQEKALYEAKIREMWKLPQFKDVAASDLYKIAKFAELSGSLDKVKQQAIEEYKAAEKQAKESSGSGNSNISNRTGGSGRSVSDLTDEEFLARNERIKAGQPN